VSGGNHHVLCTAMLTCDLICAFFRTPTSTCFTFYFSDTLSWTRGSFSRRWISLSWSSISSDCAVRSSATVRYWTLHRVSWKGCLYRSCSLEDLEVDGRVILKQILKKSIRRAWSELIWLRIGAVVNAAMNLRIPKNGWNFVIGRTTVGFCRKKLCSSS